MECASIAAVPFVVELLRRVTSSSMRGFLIQLASVVIAYGLVLVVVFVGMKVFRNVTGKDPSRLGTALVTSVVLGLLWYVTVAR